MNKIKKSLALKMATMASLPLPVTLVTSIGKDNEPNIITITYVTGVNEEPPMFGIAIRPEKHSNFLIRKSKEFVINIPTLKLIKEIDFCGTHSGRNVQKFEKLGLKPIKAKKLKTPLIGECSINIECRLKQIVKLPSHDFFIGEVTAFSVDKKIVVAKKNKYGVFLPKFDKLNFLFTTFLDYRVIGEKKGMVFQEHQKLNCKCKNKNCPKRKEGKCL
ncbi:flavin reductase family protein [Candidatus Microgenomates bacterium]|nr:flavin reductase family protein [Candidatus Microgenomates bacterium]